MIEATATGLQLNEQQTNHLSSLGDQAQMVREDEKAREIRSVENTENSAKPKMNLNTETNTEVVDNVVITEKYDDKGNLINLIPPGYVPLSTSI